MTATPALPRPATARLTHVRELVIPAVRLLCEQCDLPAARADRLCAMCRASCDLDWKEVVT